MSERSPSWAFCRTMVLRNRDGTPYLRRWRIFECPWFGVYLHRIDGPDEGRDLHDHPWPFVSIVLRGGYIEEVPDYYGVRERSVRWVNFKAAEDRHRVASVDKPTWTLVLRGPRWRRWGFLTDHGWVDHASYGGGAILE
jgi:hypothetical protein